MHDAADFDLYGRLGSYPTGQFSICCERSCRLSAVPISFRPMKFLRFAVNGETIVVTFDMCSSSDVFEDLMLRGRIDRFLDFVSALKHHLADAQDKIKFTPYKFTGDGWILLFPKATADGPRLLAFLRELSIFYMAEFAKCLLPHLGTPPGTTGLTFGIEEGNVTSTMVFQKKEHVGRPITIACRLQAAVNEVAEKKPAYKALVSSTVFDEYFASIPGLKARTRYVSLRNIRGGRKFRCKLFSLAAHRVPGRRSNG